MKRNVVMIGLLTLAIGLVMGCDLFPAYTGTNVGSALFTDAQKHFTEDVTYTYSNSTETYRKDGSYEFISSAWNSATGSWQPFDGQRGTYTWDAATYELVTINTGYYSRRSGSWVDLPTGESWSTTCPKLFTAHANQDVYAVSGSTLTYTSTHGDMVTIANGSNTYTYSNAYTFGGGVFSQVDTWSNSSGAIFIGHKRSGNIVGSFPANDKLQVGSTITYHCQDSAVQDWNATTSAWEDVDYYASWSRSFTLLNDKFAVSPNSNLTRGLFARQN